MDNFHDIRFPQDISYGASGGPEFSTDIATSVAGMEYRNINWSAPRSRYAISYNFISEEKMQKLINFFMARRGKAYAFRYKDHCDYKVDNGYIATSDGKETQYQLIKIYGDEVAKFTRIITKPVKDKVEVMINGIKENCMIDYLTGIITFPKAPKKNSIITANFEFDIMVRFDEDYFDGTIDDYNSFSWGNINLVEVK